MDDMLKNFMGNLDTGVLVTVCGIVIVFLVLIILIGAITIFGKIMVAGTKKDNKEKKSSPKVEINPAPVKATTVKTVSSQDEDEIIAVIAAAVDAIYSGSGKKAVIRNIKPAVGGGRSAWATAGVMQNVRSF